MIQALPERMSFQEFFGKTLAKEAKIHLGRSQITFIWARSCLEYRF